MFSCSIVVTRVLEGVPDHNNFLVVPSITKGVVLVKLPDKSDADCLHRHVYEWKDHSVRFSKVDNMVMVHVDISVMRGSSRRSVARNSLQSLVSATLLVCSKYYCSVLDLCL